MVCYALILTLVLLFKTPFSFTVILMWFSYSMGNIYLNEPIPDKTYGNNKSAVQPGIPVKFTPWIASLGFLLYLCSLISVFVIMM